MNRKWATINSWFVVGVTCAAAWIVGGGDWVALGQSQDGYTANTSEADSVEWHPPVTVENPSLTVENPFFVRPPVAETPVSTPIPPPSSPWPAVEDLTLPIEGESVDVDLPTIRRLPPVTPWDSQPEAPEGPSESEWHGLFHLEPVVGQLD